MNFWQRFWPGGIPSEGRTAADEVSVPFRLHSEQHLLAVFREGGHFVPQMRQRDAEGNPTTQRREWAGRDDLQ